MENDQHCPPMAGAEMPDPGPSVPVGATAALVAAIDQALQPGRQAVAPYQTLVPPGGAVASTLDDLRPRLRLAEDTVRTLSAAVEQSPACVVITDAAGLIEYVNAKFCQLTGYSAAEAIGQNPRILQSGQTPPDAYVALWQTVTSGGTWTGTFANRKKDGEQYWEQASIAPIRDAEGVIRHLVAVKEDITARLRSEDALRESERKYRLLFEHMTAAFALHEIIYDETGTPADYRFLEMNPAFERLTGLSAAMLLGKTVREVLPEIEDYWIEAYGKVVVTGEPLSYQNYARELDRYYDTFSYRPAPGQFAVVFTDVTERVRAEAALRRSEQDFRLLAENATDMVSRHAPDGTYLYVSPSCRALVGYEPEELMGRSPAEILPPSRGSAIEASRQQVIAQPITQTVIQRYRRKDGTYVWLESTIHAVRDEASGAVIEIQAAARDITERKLAEETLQALAQERTEQAAAAEALAEASAALAMSLEPARLYEIILQQMARVVPCTTAHIFEYRDGHAVTAGGYGQPHLPAGVRVSWLEGAEGLFPQAEDQARLLPETRGASGWRNTPPWVGAYEVRSTIILPLLVHGHLYGCLGIGSSTPGFYGHAHFQVARAFAERIAQALWNARLYQLEQQRARAAEQLAAMRSDFVAAVSHELRTPLTAVLGYGELLQAYWDTMTDADRRAKVDRMVVAANRQRKLVEDLLRVSQVETSTPGLRTEPVSLAEVVIHAAEMLHGSYRNQSIATEGSADLVASADPSYTEQILTNLLDNAAKYSPEGSPIYVTWGLEGGMTVLRVRDPGPGIPVAGREILFTRFGRVPGSRMRAGHVGTGLGLYLGRAFAEAMGGTLELESTGPMGTVFCLRLPAAVTSSDQ